MRIPMLMGVNVEKLCSDNEIGPRWTDDYWAGDQRLREILEARQEAGERVWGILLAATAYSLSKGRPIEFYTDQDVPHKLVAGIVEATPIPNLLAMQ